LLERFGAVLLRPPHPLRRAVALQNVQHVRDWRLRSPCQRAPQRPRASCSSPRVATRNRAQDNTPGRDRGASDIAHTNSCDGLRRVGCVAALHGTLGEPQRTSRAPTPSVQPPATHGAKTCASAGSALLHLLAL